MATFNYELLIPPEDTRETKDQRYRLTWFSDWANKKGLDLDELDLATYRDYLERRRQYAPNTVKSHLGSVRARLNEFIQDGTLRYLLVEQLRETMPMSEAISQADTVLGKLMLSLMEKETFVQVKPEQAQNLLLDESHINQLFDGLKITNRLKLRNAAILTLMLATGLREAEVSAIRVSDLRHTYSEKPALHIPAGRGCTERTVPYRDMEWVLQVVGKWLAAAKIGEGPVFRGVHAKSDWVSEKRLSPRSVERSFDEYSIELDGEQVALRPLDVRQVYARHLYHTGVDLETIRQYLGIKQLATVLGYVGPISREPATGTHKYHFDLKKLGRRF